MIFKDEQYIQLALIDEEGNLRFTPEYLEATKDLPGARKLASHLITHWEGDNFSTVLDYFGPDEGEADQFSGIDGQPMDIRPDLMELWDYKDLALPGLNAEWYADILRAKLVSIRLPERLIKEYVKAANKYYSGGK